jgi:hypothetical protein
MSDYNLHITNEGKYMDTTKYEYKIRTLCSAEPGVRRALRVSMGRVNKEIPNHIKSGTFAGPRLFNIS